MPAPPVLRVPFPCRAGVGTLLAIPRFPLPTPPITCTVPVVAGFRAVTCVMAVGGLLADMVMMVLSLEQVGLADDMLSSKMIFLLGNYI